MEKLQGKIDYWKDARNSSQVSHGVVIIKAKDFRIERFFLSFADVVICQPDTPYRNCIVCFELGPKVVLTSRQLPRAYKAEIYEPTKVVAEIAQAMETEGRSGGAL